MRHSHSFDDSHDDLAASAEWYLTVRCTNPACSNLIAFQKSRFESGDGHARLQITGSPALHCPHCKTLVRFGAHDVERKRVVLGRADGSTA